MVVAVLLLMLGGWGVVSFRWKFLEILAGGSFLCIAGCYMAIRIPIDQTTGQQ